MVAKKKTEDVIEVPAIRRESIEICLLGETPLIFNRMAEKAKRELLLPHGPKTAAEKKTTLKHDPLTEYRDSVYRFDAGDAGDAVLGFPSPGFKKAIAAAALDLPGATKTSIERLTRVHGYRVPIYGVPMIFMTAVRSADAKKTPDIRSRAIVPEWACRIQVSYVRPLLTAKTIANLLSAAGEIVGIGDFRQGKGAGDFGLFRLVEPTDEEFLRRLKAGAEEQELALKEPAAYDSETAELLDWYDAELIERGVTS